MAQLFPEDFQFAWFVCTDPKSTQSEKDKWTKSVLNYCAKDTLAVADLIKHFETQKFLFRRIYQCQAQ